MAIVLLANGVESLDAIISIQPWKMFQCLGLSVKTQYTRTKRPKYCEVYSIVMSKGNVNYIILVLLGNQE